MRNQKKSISTQGILVEKRLRQVELIELLLILGKTLMINKKL